MDMLQVFENATTFFSGPAGHAALMAGLDYDGKDVSPELFEKIQITAAQGLSQIAGQIIIKHTPIVSITKTAISGKDMAVTSRKWALTANRMNGASTLHCFVLTLGSALDGLISETEEESFFDAYVLDRLGSLFAEKAADELETRLRSSLIKKGRHLSRRFSPGYCDWDLDKGQRALSMVLSPETIDVTFLPGGAMQPGKTVSGVMISADEVPCHSPCFFCEDKACRHRRSIKCD